MLNHIKKEPFYADLIRAECQPRANAGREDCTNVPPAALSAARRSSRQMDIGWVLLWPGTPQTVHPYLRETGFTFDYQADGVRVYRPAAASTTSSWYLIDIEAAAGATTSLGFTGTYTSNDAAASSITCK